MCLMCCGRLLRTFIATFMMWSCCENSFVYLGSRGTFTKLSFSWKFVSMILVGQVFFYGQSSFSKSLFSDLTFSMYIISGRYVINVQCNLLHST